ncbi:MAG: hypothetical protein PHO64_13985 [Thiomonas sp.]|nr:hypothetical protein [Thiomonas sp.]
MNTTAGTLRNSICPTRTVFRYRLADVRGTGRAAVDDQQRLIAEPASQADTRCRGDDVAAEQRASNRREHPDWGDTAHGACGHGRFSPESC